MSSFFDGKELTDIRPNVVKPNFHAIKSMVFYNGSFYWTDGDKVLHEIYDQHGKKYHHNKIHFEENHFGGFNLLHPSAQPTPGKQKLHSFNGINIVRKVGKKSILLGKIPYKRHGLYTSPYKK